MGNSNPEQEISDSEKQEEERIDKGTLNCLPLLPMETNEVLLLLPYEQCPTTHYGIRTANIKPLKVSKQSLPHEITLPVPTKCKQKAASKLIVLTQNHSAGLRAPLSPISCGGWGAFFLAIWGQLFKTQVLFEESFISLNIFPLLLLSHSLFQGLSVYIQGMQMDGNPGFVRPKAYTICWGRRAQYKKEYIIRLDSEYLFRIRKITNYKYKKADKNTSTHTQILKNN